jgi:hypothetical protein
MLRFYVATPEMSPKDLQEFVQRCMLSPDHIVSIARARSIPDACPKCGEKLEKLAYAYGRIPSADQTTMFFETLAGVATCVQHASGCCAEKITYSLRAIVQRHLYRELTAAGHACTPSII